MKKLLVALLIFGPFLARSQAIVQKTGAPNVRVEHLGTVGGDSGVYVGTRDTLFTPNVQNLIVVRPQDGIAYIFQSHWTPLGQAVWGKISGTLSNQTDLQNALNAKQNTLTNGYGWLINGSAGTFDSAHVRKVDTMYRVNDSTIGYKINGISYSALLRGTAAGGINSLVLTVPTVLYSNPITFSNSGGSWTGVLALSTQSPNTFLAGPTSGAPTTPTMRLIALSDLPTGIPNGNLQNSVINFSMDNTGTVPGWSGSSVALGNTQILHLPYVSPTTAGILSAAQYNALVSGGAVTSVNGQVGAVSVGNADSLGGYPIDFTNFHNGYLLSVDTVHSKLVFVAPGGGGGGVTTASGDATGTAVGSNLPLTLATVNTSPGTYGDAAHIPQITVSGKGLLPSVSNLAIQIAESQVTNLITDLAGKLATVSTTKSVIGNGTSGSPIQLSGDLATDTSAYYGFDGAGSLGYHTLPSGITAANPTATVGLSPINGSASTFMRSDAAPPLSLSIAPTWSGVHTFSQAPIFSSLTGYLHGNGAGAVTASATIPNSGLATMANNTFKGNVSGSTASPSDLSVSQMITALGVMQNFGGAPGQLEGTYAGIPAATSYNTGTTYVAQDSGIVYVDTGSGGSRGWKLLARGPQTFNLFTWQGVKPWHGSNDTLALGGTLSEPDTLDFGYQPFLVQHVTNEATLAGGDSAVILSSGDQLKKVPTSAFGGLSPIANNKVLLNSSGSSAAPIAEDVPVYYMSWYGVDATGVTDASVIANSVYASVAAAGGGTIVWPAGLFRLKHPINVNGRILTKGQGRGPELYTVLTTPMPSFGATTFIIPTANDTAFYINGVSGDSAMVCGISDLAIKDTSTTTPTVGAAIILGEVANTTIRNVATYNFYRGIDIVSAISTEIDHCIIVGAYQDGLRINNLANPDFGGTRAHDNTFLSGNRTTTTARGIYIGSGGAIDLYENRFNGENPTTVNTNFMQDIYFDFANGPSSEVHIDQCYFNNYQNNGVYGRNLSGGNLYLLRINSGHWAPLPTTGTSLSAIDIKGWNEVVISGGVGYAGGVSSSFLSVDSAQSVFLGPTVSVGWTSPYSLGSHVTDFHAYNYVPITDALNFQGTTSGGSAVLSNPSIAAGVASLQLSSSANNTAPLFAMVPKGSPGFAPLFNIYGLNSTSVSPYFQIGGTPGGSWNILSNIVGATQSMPINVKVKSFTNLTADTIGQVLIPSLASGSTAPTTSGTTYPVIADANGRLSFNTSGPGTTPTWTATLIQGGGITGFGDTTTQNVYINGYAPNNNQLMVGDLSWTSLALNSALVASDNFKYTGGAATAIHTGYVERIQLNNDQYLFQFSPGSVTAGATPTLQTTFKVDSAGVAMGGHIAAPLNTYNGATMVVNGSDIKSPSGSTNALDFNVANQSLTLLASTTAGGLRVQEQNTAGWAFNAVQHARGSTLGTPTITQSGDTAGLYAFGLYDGSIYQSSALLLGIADSAVSAGSAPEKIVLSTGHSFATATPAQTWSHTGAIAMPKYGSNNITGTATTNAAFDASGNVIETPLKGAIWTATANGATLSNSTAETSILATSSVGSLTVGANALSVGETITFHGFGYVQTNASGQQMQLAVTVGGTDKLIGIAYLPNTSSSSTPFEFTGSFTIITTGTSGTAIGSISFNLAAPAGSSSGNYTTVASPGSTFSINTTISNALGLTGTWNNASASNNITLLNPFNLKIE